MSDRTLRAREDSDVSYFHDLLLFGEFLIKLIACGMVASLETDKDRQRYRLEHGLVRSNGVGDWVAAIDDVLVGPASQHIRRDARVEQRQLNQRFPAKGEHEWQVQSVRHLHSACCEIDPNFGDLSARVSLRVWLKDFVWLRNKTRGHGALLASQCSSLCPALSSSIDLITDNFTLFKRSWAFLHRNISGKYRVVRIAGDCTEFEYLKRESDHSLAEGVNVFFGEPAPAPLMKTDLDLSDFYFPNGNFRDEQFELLSYISGQTREGNGSDYLVTPTDLPVSETAGVGTLEDLEEVFCNLPVLPQGYVDRPDLEQELAKILANDRHPVVTLVGRGGIGKTSLALKVLRDIVAHQTHFVAILWFSARDIDLLTEGPKIVRPEILSEADIAEQYVDLVQPRESADKGFDARTFFSSTLTRSAIGPTLFVFDNFETVKNPADLFNWLDTHIRLPNKVLITTRGRDFRGDYHLTVRGMVQSEFNELVKTTAQRLGIQHLLTHDYLQSLFTESGGHPYVVKVLLGEVADAGKLVSAPRIMASRDDILSALFDRTFSNLPPVAVRIFLTLSNWRSAIPRVALEAALLRPENVYMDIEAGLDRLSRSSMIEVLVSPHGDEFVSTPLVAALFGKKKLLVSPYKSMIEADMEMLRLVGPTSEKDVRLGLQPRVNRLFKNVSEIIDTSARDLAHFLPVIEYVARKFPPAWIQLADLYIKELGSKGRPAAIEAIRQYLEARPDDLSAWTRLARACSAEQDFLAEANSYVQRAVRPECSYYDVSFAANRLNALVGEGRLQLDQAELSALTWELIEVMEQRITEASSNDYSRLAWLYVHTGDNSKALQWIETGLENDPDNEHCLKLRERLTV